ncbi:PP2C family protein-serine/threonine phosphatase [Streptomyces triticirhizae]|uniref:PP2C family protein-serine/threonine phosphatase n=1 Tax=Streptomyces triticirhizae TaxID=2483353 RepID=UPI001F40D984|nr:protein phosphatase 2C domain-containing protein [Streptomyces triticirhizae]
MAFHRAGGEGVLAVFDGSGGAGAAPAWEAPDGDTRSGAWVGSRVARLAVESWFHRAVTRRDGDSPDALRDDLGDLLALAPSQHSKITGTMRRSLPTTLAGLRFWTASGEIRWQALWAGDSRAYVLSPRFGLQAVTRDHTEETDTLELLRSDPPMTNVISRDRPFHIETQRMTLHLPCVLLAATDGFFGYVHTPADFELLLLDTLSRAGDMAGWATELHRLVSDYSGDDASLSLVALGYADFEQLRHAFMPRGETLTAWLRRGGRPSVEGDAMRRWQDRTWAEYRGDYERLLRSTKEGSA